MRCKDLFFCLASLALLTEQTSAGAWPRGKGKVFLSYSSSLTWPDGRPLELPDIYGGIYAEYGLSKRLTFGLDVGSPDATRPNRLKAIGFFRYSLSAPSAAHQFAFDVGAGKYLGEPVVRIGGSYGKGISLFSRSGWMSLDAHMLVVPSSRATTRSIDATLGVNLPKGKAMGLLSMHRSATGDSTYTFTPSYAYQIDAKRHIDIGVSFNLDSGSDPALKLGVWQEF
ncbi:hypothetical protein [Planktotalea sp.]|uniref:hypothetical protein n=1 Tax=Planktotalea sp. TaxID=2029877 RepID=UPI0032980834